MALGHAFGSMSAAVKGLDGYVRSRARGLSASLSTALVGTWSSRRAMFEAVPRELRTTDPTRALELVEGYIALADKVVELNGRKLFDIDAPSPAFARAQHSFEWLRHMRAYTLASSPSRARSVAAGIARDHTLNWIARRRKHPALANNPLMAARRALSLTNHAAFVLDGATPEEYRAIMTMILRDTREAFTRRAEVRDPTDHCFLVVACASVAYALAEHIAIKQLTRDALAIALKQAINAEGGPHTRRPADLALLLPEMLALQALIATRNLAQPPRLGPAIQGGLQMLRMLRHPNGSLARFQGTRSIVDFESDLVATVLTYDTDRSALPALAPKTGYARLEAPKSVLLMDCGGPPLADGATQAHASALAFEWSYANTKIITSAPEIGYSVDASLVEQRGTQAHSTLVASGLSSATLASRTPDAVLYGGMTVEASTRDMATGPGITARHTGYRQRLGVDHARTLTLSQDGTLLEGEDQLLLASGQPAPNDRTPYALYFQLQPGARVTPEGTTKMRIKARHQMVIFETDSGTLQVDNPTDRPTYRGPASALRMIVHSPKAGPAKITWRFIAV